MERIFKQDFRGYLTFKIALLIVTFFLPINIVFIISSQRMIEKVEQQVQLSTQNITDVYINTLEMRMERADYYLYSCYERDADFIALRNTDNEVEYANKRHGCIRSMDKERELSTDITAFYMYLEARDDYLVSSGAYTSKEKIVDFLKDHMQAERKWMLYEMDGVQYLVRATCIKDIYYGTFISLNNQKRLIEKSLNFNNVSIRFEKKNKDVEYEGHTISVTENHYADMKLVVEISKSEIRANLSFWEKGQIVVAFLFIGLLPLLYIFLKHWMLRPLGILNAAHYQLEIGNEDYRIKELANSYEFTEAYRSFNKMADNMHSLKLENMEKELAKEKLLLNNLQLQIRPHFLLNTFNLIFNLASEKKIDNIKELVIYLSNYFRHIFRSGKELELFAKELRLIKGYMKSVEMRYEGAIHITYQIDPEILMVRLPPLLIHNFIENTVNHAMVKEKVLHIMLQGDYLDGTVTFIISDDGTGINGEIVEMINAGKFIEAGGSRVHIGIQNSIMRIKYFYGEQAKIEVSSELGFGTVFIISFPYNLEET